MPSPPPRVRAGAAASSPEKYAAHVDNIDYQGTPSFFLVLSFWRTGVIEMVMGFDCIVRGGER